jgi:hypothetical protein
MVKPDPLEYNELLVDEILRLLEPVLDYVNKKVLAKPLNDLTHQASKSASFGSSRSQGGQAGELARRMDDEFGTSLFPNGQLRGSPELASLSYVESDIVRERKVVRQTGLKRKTHVGVKTQKSTTHSEYFDAQAVKAWPQRIRTMAEDDFVNSGGRFYAKIQAVLEPLKCRIISKGPAAPYYFSKPLQERLHSTLRNMPCFRLIGRPVSPTDLIDIVDRREGKEWFSGDYKASTDAISARLSREILSRLTQGLPENDRQIYLQVLAPHHIVYPTVMVDGRKETVEEVDQVNGQLMGSILSFPVLCLANLGLYLRATMEDVNVPTEILKKQVWKALTKVLVNGDDILYCATRKEYERHCELGKDVGLEMSVGKTYLHGRYANINSVSFDYDLSNDESTPREIGFFNSGLFFVQNKVMARVGDEEEADEEEYRNPTVSVINALLDGVRTGRRSKVDVLTSYLTLHKDKLAKETKGRSLFIARSFGGFGVQIPTGFSPRVQTAQFLYANALSSAMSERVVDVHEQPTNRVVRRPWLRFVEMWSDREISKELTRLRADPNIRHNPRVWDFYFSKKGVAKRWFNWLWTRVKEVDVVAPGYLE